MPRQLLPGGLAGDKNVTRNHCIDRIDSAADWRHTQLASQPWLGLRAQWRLGANTGGTAHPLAHGKNLGSTTTGNSD